ncbi:DNA-binding transcriptional ArsR family regulator [Leucobacter aridicollis]|uniref:DNA-binding transcriptional ArsR family regulator n=2 Tax=Leucobacter aridicollis TaxID=283878 RepID=A0A852QZ59_9MICO|nr:DNA-binding transcriptional ArsR family regulator [Leucobacter aridicollis]
MSEMPEPDETPNLDVTPDAGAPVGETADAEAVADVGAGDGFVAPAPMERDREEYFAGDRGVLDPVVRRVLVRLLQRRVLFADRHKDDWAVLLENHQVIESRLHDLFIRLIVDPERGVAYKQQVRSEELEVPVLLRDEAYNRAETLVLVYLRTVYQRESTAGEPAVRIDVEEIEQTVLSYFTDSDGNTAARQKTVEKALNRLRNEGIIDEESEGRFRVTPLVEVVLSADRLRELQRWLKEQVADTAEKIEDTAS